MNKLVVALTAAGSLVGGFFLGRWYTTPSAPTRRAGKKPFSKVDAKAKRDAQDPRGWEAIAALAKNDPEIADFIKANPGLVAKARKDPSSVSSDPTFIAWAMSHEKQVAAIQAAMKGGAVKTSTGLALPAGPASVGELGAAATTTLQPGEVAPILDAKGAWGGVPFDTASKAADLIFGAMDKAGFKGSFDASIQISDSGKVTIVPTVPALAGPLQAALGAKMTAALKGQSLPAGGLTVPWLEGVRNV